MRVKYLGIIADNLKKAGWSWGCVSAIDSNGRKIWIADAHCDDGRRVVVQADEKLTAFLELESAIQGRQSAERIAERVKESSTNCRRAGKSLLDYVIRRFTLSSARLNKSQGLDLR